MKKTMKRSLALGALMVFVITGSAMAADYDKIVVKNGENKTITENDVNVDYTGFQAVVVQGVDSSLNVKSDTINITTKAVGTGDSDAVFANEGGKIVLGDDTTSNIVINNTYTHNTKQFITGITAWNNDSYVELNSKNVEISVFSSGTGTISGLFVQNGDDTHIPEDGEPTSEVVINADKTTIIVNSDNENASTTGITNYSGGRVTINGDVEIKADDILVTRGNAVTKINANGQNNIVKLDGNINFNVTNDGNSGLKATADVNINLTNSESYFNGNIITTQEGKPSTSIDMNVSNMSLGVSNGAVWTSDKDSFVNNLTVKDGGIINMAGNGQKLSIDNLTADSAIVKTNDVNNQMVVSKDANAQNVTVEGSGAIADQIAAGETDASKLADVVVKKDETAGTSTTVVDKVTTDEGVIGGRFEGFVDEKGNVTGSQAKNTTNTAISEMGSIALMAWRQENNDMNKRLGELRNSNGEHGIWTRMTRGESEFKSVKNQYNAYQIGYDEKLSTDKSWTVGAALTYTDAQSSFAGGSGENTHKGFAVYGSKLNEDGSFIDLIAKYARLEHEFDAVGGIGKGEYDTNGYSVSAEYGKRFDKGNGFWVEPQVELTYGKVGSVNYATDKAMAYQDGMESLVGRVGFSLGKDIKDGNVYVRASYLYDFDGETQVTMMSKDGKVSDTYEQDLGGGWFEVGVGTNINLSDATYVYFDVEKTYGGDVATPWQWNAGVRYSF